MDVPRPGKVFLSQDWNFSQPDFIGDTIIPKAEILFAYPEKPVTPLAFIVTRSDGKVVLKGEAWCNPMSPDPNI